MPMNDRASFLLIGLCIFNTVETLFFIGLIAVGVIQYQRKSVSVTAQSHLMGLHFIPLSANRLSI